MQSNSRSADRPRPAPSGPSRPASLGPSISLSGNLSGSEDLIIEGSVEGEINVRDHKVTISETGNVKADIYGRSICVEGRVDGNLVGDEQVVIRQSGRVRGNVTAPRVNLENGAKFKGSIDMQPGSKGDQSISAEASGKAAKAPATGSRKSKSTVAAAAPSTQSA
ncbi:MAG: polymer-forming cytoskeletal protein [Thermoanaerobaculia bacterium]